MKKNIFLSATIAVLMIFSMTACNGSSSTRNTASGSEATSAKKAEKQAKADASAAATDFLSLLTELRWGEAANMTENELKTKMPGINDMDWGVPAESDMVEYEDMLKICLRSTRTIVADAENAKAVTDGKYIVACRVEMPTMRTFIDLIAQNGWKTVADVETNISSLLQDVPKETVQVTLLMKEEKGPSGLTDYKVCATSDISGLSVIFE